MITRLNIFYLLIILFYSCTSPSGDDKLKIINNSDDGIYFYYSCDSVLNELHIYRNGINYSYDSIYIISDQYVKSKSSVNVLNKILGRDAWNVYVTRCKSKLLNIFIFSESTVNKYSDDSLRQNKLYIKRMSFTLEDLEKNNWVVTYP